MKRYSVRIVDNGSGNVTTINGDIMLVSLANLDGDKMECYNAVDKECSLEEIMRLHLSQGREIQEVRVSDKYNTSNDNVGQKIEYNNSKF
jgi:hypothetical protein